MKLKISTDWVVIGESILNKRYKWNDNYEEDLEEFKNYIKREIEEQEMYYEYENKKFIKQLLEEFFPDRKPFDKWFDFEE